MADNGGVPFSVVYFDGERETDAGQVMVNPSLNWKSFQYLLSQKFGISPNQFSVYLASLGSNRKILMTGKVNFAAIAREKGAFFLVKRSKRSRKNKTQNKTRKDANNGDHCLQSDEKKNPPEKVMLLRRNVGFDEKQPFCGLNTPFVHRVEYEKRVRNLQIERERYLTNMGLSDLGYVRGSNGGEERSTRGSLVVCEECFKEKRTGRDGGFHWCVYDTVTVGFRSPAGPIARPIKSSG